MGRARRTAFGDFKIRAGRLGFGNCEYLGLERRRAIWPVSFLYIKELLSSLVKEIINSHYTT
jgi:hypothetical protein